MPLRPFLREVTWMFPPSLDELVPLDHPVRFVAAFVDALPPDEWVKLGVMPSGANDGAPAYHQRAVLGVWLYGFMTGIRSCRKLETAAREQLPFLWLSGLQQPDHNTLWRFYRNYRDTMRELFTRTVRTAVGAGLVDLAVQAVDGTKIAGSANSARTLTVAELIRLLGEVDAAIVDLESQNRGGEDPPLPRLPTTLQGAEALRTRVEQALARATAEDGPGRANVTDPDARMMKGRHGYLTGYNPQAMVSPLDPEVAGRTGLLITEAQVTTDPDDHSSLAPMLVGAEATVEQRVPLTLADGGYHSGPNLAQAQADGHTLVMPEAQRKFLRDPYHKSHFVYDPDTDTFTCPQGQTLRFQGEKHRTDRPITRVYRSTGAMCRGCPAFGMCTKNGRSGRTLEVGPEEAVLQAHRAWMATDAAREAFRQRKTLPEPVFGILKEQCGARRFLLRGLEKVKAEWLLLATAFNLRTLAGVWRGQLHQMWRAQAWQGAW